MKACCSTESCPSGARPSTVVTSQPLACTANIRHARAERPSTSTVQAPHTPCSQPRCVPVRLSSWRRKSASVSRASTTRAYDLPFTVTRVACLPICNNSVKNSRLDAGAARRIVERARAQHLRQMPPVVAAGMDIGNRLDQPCSRGGGTQRGGIERLADQPCLGGFDPHRRWGDAEQGQRGAPHHIVGADIEQHRRPRNGEIAVAAGELVKAVAVAEPPVAAIISSAVNAVV